MRTPLGVEVLELLKERGMRLVLAEPLDLDPMTALTDDDFGGLATALVAEVNRLAREENNAQAQALLRALVFEVAANSLPEEDTQTVTGNPFDEETWPQADEGAREP